MKLIERFTFDELEYLAGLHDADPAQKLTPNEISDARDLLVSAHAYVGA